MSRQEFGPFSFEPPAAWKRQATVSFVAPEGDPSAPPNILVTHEPRAPGEDIQAHAWRAVFAAARSLPDFEVAGSREVKVDGQPGFVVSCTWKSNLGPVKQDFAWIDGPDATALAVTCTSIDTPEAVHAFDRLLASLRFGGGASRPSVVPLSPSQPPPPPAVPPEPEMIPMPGTRTVRR
jgi:hypothetical protein